MSKEKPDFIRKAILSRDTETLRRAGARGGAKKKKVAPYDPATCPPDRKTASAGKDHD